MTLPVLQSGRRMRGKEESMRAHYYAMLFLSLHWASVVYINSSYLEQFTSQTIITFLYTIGAIFTVIAFLYAPRILNRYGNIRLIYTFIALEVCAFLGIATSSNIYIVGTFFVLHQMMVTLLYFNLDILVEAAIGTEEGATGRRRGLFLTISSFTTALAPFFVGKLVGSGDPNFTLAYLASGLTLIPFLFCVVRGFHDFKDPEYPHLDIWSGLRLLATESDLRNVFFAHFLLQFFFTWMVIYTPLYLATVIKLNWEQIGNILAVGLMAYVFLEYLIGYIADTWLGEKEMMAFGFLVTGVSTSWFTFISTESVVFWMTAMFTTRIGASLIEATTESYFFKHTHGDDTNLISLFRITRPLSYVLGALIGGITLTLLPFNLLFTVLGLLMVPGLFFAMSLADTR